jgi:Protein of unknown function (DUF1573)
MKKLLIASVALFSSVALLAQVKFVDHIKFKTEEHDFGKIKQGVPVTYDFAISNIGKTPVVVESATATCGCTTPVKPEQPIMPGDANKITAGFNAAALGLFNRPITIKLAGVDETKVIIIKGEVLSAEEYDAYVKTKGKETKDNKGKPNK